MVFECKNQPGKLHSKDRKDLEDLLRYAAARLASKLPERSGGQAEADEPVTLVAAAR